MPRKKPGPDVNREEEYRQDAERLALLPVADQKEIVALHQPVADNPKLPKAERDTAQERVAALERHLRRLNRTRR